MSWEGLVLAGPKRQRLGYQNTTEMARSRTQIEQNGQPTRRINNLNSSRNEQ